MKPRHEWRWKQQKIAVEKKREGYAENAWYGVSNNPYRFPTYQYPMQPYYPYQQPVYPFAWQPWPIGFQGQQFFQTQNKESS